MTSEQALRIVVEELEATQVPYVIVGSFASNAHGEARATHDLDIVVDANLQIVARIHERLKPEYRLDPQIHFETVTGTTFVRMMNQTDDFGIEVFRLSEQPHDQERFKRRTRNDLGDLSAYILTAEDVLITKLNWLHRYGRPKDHLDAENVMATQWDMLDWKYVESWAERMGFESTLTKVRTAVGARLAPRSNG